MPAPVRNWLRTVDGVKTFPDFQERELHHYVPLRVWGDLAESTLGQSVAIRGELDFDLPKENYDGILAELGRVRLAPLVPMDVQSTFAIRIAVPAPHQLSIKSINSFPYPKFVLTGTLKRAEVGSNELLDKIRVEWAARSLLVGHLVCSFDMLDVEGGYDIGLAYRDIRSVLSASVGDDPLPVDVGIGAVRHYVESQFDTLAVKLDSAVMQSRRAEAIAFVSEKVFSALFRTGIDLYEFDDGRKVRAAVLRSSLELVPAEKLILSRTTNTVLSAVTV